MKRLFTQEIAAHMRMIMKVRSVGVFAAVAVQGWMSLSTVNAAGDVVEGDRGKRPNIVVIMADDMGYSDIGCFGSEIETPHLDRLAAAGLRFTQFYNTGRCCPTRASLLSGLYQHQAGIGWMTSESPAEECDTGYPAYRGSLTGECVTIAETLKTAGYRTLMTGKWHIGTFEGMWPLDRGFDRYFGIIRGASNFFNPAPDKLLMLDRTPVKPGKGFYVTDAFTDHAIAFIDEAEQRDDDQPFFLYLAYTAAHWPLNAWPQDIAKYRGRYREGWDKTRRERFERMKKQGVISEECELSGQNAVAWESLSAEKQDEMDLRMATYAAQIDRMDQNIGRLVEALDQAGELDSTLILYFQDNGGCAEGGMLGRGSKEEIIAGKGYMVSYGRAWANVSNTPFKLYKHWVNEGGISTPMIAHWPGGIKARGQIRQQPAHLIDVMATCVDLAGATYPSEFEGHKIPPMEGVSLAPAFDPNKPLERTLYFEHEGNRAVRDGKWKLVAEYGKPWTLHNTDTDRSEMHDLSAEEPEVVKDLLAKYETWALRVGVRPWVSWEEARTPKPGYVPPKRDYPKTSDDLDREGVGVKVIEGRGETWKKKEDQ